MAQDMAFHSVFDGEKACKARMRGGSAARVGRRKPLIPPSAAFSPPKWGEGLFALYVACLPAAAAESPEPPLPLAHVREAGIPACAPMVERMSREALTSDYNVQSGWSLKDPPHHVFQSVAGLKYPKNNPSNALAAIIAAPLGENECDGVVVQVYPLGVACEVASVKAQAGGRALADLLNIKVVLNAAATRLFFMPGFGKTCVVVSVVSYFGKK